MVILNKRRSSADIVQRDFKIIYLERSILIFNMVFATIIERGFQDNFPNYGLFYILLLWII